MSFPDTVVLFILALLLFGPKKLPGIARQVGKALNEFKRASNEFKAQIESEINQLDIREQQKERDQFQQRLESKTDHDVLAPSEPPAGAVSSSRHSPESAPEPFKSPNTSEDVNFPAHDPTNA